MAIDTIRKRKAVVGVARWARPRIIQPDGSFGVQDRKVIGWAYNLIDQIVAGRNETSLLLMRVGI